MNDKESQDTGLARADGEAVAEKAVHFSTRCSFHKYQANPIDIESTKNTSTMKLLIILITFAGNQLVTTSFDAISLTVAGKSPVPTDFEIAAGDQRKVKT